MGVAKFYGKQLQAGEIEGRLMEDRAGNWDNTLAEGGRGRAWGVAVGSKDLIWERQTKAAKIFS